MNRYYYSNSISNFLNSSTNEIIGELTRNSEFTLLTTQTIAWESQIEILKESIINYDGSLFFEYSIPRMGRRIDVVLIIKNVIFVLEFKVGEKEFLLSAIDQVWDYALDLKNFHETSHKHLLAPILIATESKDFISQISRTPHNDNLLYPIKSNPGLLREVIENILRFAEGESIVSDNWANGKIFTNTYNYRSSNCSL